jgi:hypothetical protein
VKASVVKVHRAWFMRAALVLVLTGSIEAIVVWYATHPLPWVMLISASLPLSMIIFVVRPVLKQEARESQADVHGRD